MRKVFVFFLINIFYHNPSLSQIKLKFISKYYLGFDKESLQETFSIAGKRFAFGKDNIFYLNDLILDSISKDSTFHLEVYKDRYLFVSFYLVKPNMQPTTAEIAEKLRVKIYDLRNPKKRWSFYFAGYNSLSFRWFKPNRGKIKLIRKDILVGNVSE